MTNNHDALKSCPFCGGEPTIESWDGCRQTTKLISCPGITDSSISGKTCAASPMVVGDTKKEAIENWNTRAADVSIPADVQSAEALSDEIWDIVTDRDGCSQSTITELINQHGQSLLAKERAEKQRLVDILETVQQIIREWPRMAITKIEEIIEQALNDVREG